jgi:UTP---glucose-1-phosphate uridylyltransferase
MIFAMDFEQHIETLEPLANALKKTRDLGEKQELLIAYPKVAACLSEGVLRPFFPHEHDLSAKIAFYSVVAIEQHTALFTPSCPPPPKEKVRALLSMLVSIDKFYESIGGIIGYHVQVLKLLVKNQEKSLPRKGLFARANGIDLAAPSGEVDQAVWAGIQALGEIGEIYPIGGLGSRFNLRSKGGDPLPVACLSFCGRTLLEGLVRDVQAREFLYYRLFERQVTVPIAMMTSLEKQNTARVRSICEKKRWFGRPKESFFLFPQLSVPVVTQEGKWSLKAPLEMNLQPGGHGALWKAAEERGVFLWFEGQEKSHLLIRQINNPIAGLDLGLLALMGVGKKEKKTFGFASCKRLPHAAEGVLVLVEEEGVKRLSNIEYTDFKRYGIDDLPTEDGYSLYPANTNILYANLQQILPLIKQNPLPGLILNMKSKEPFLCPSGQRREEVGGRLESMMQNISDGLHAPNVESLPTFLTYNERKKTISAAKRSFEKGQKLLETPEGAYYDLLYNAHDLLKLKCGTDIPPFSSEEEYLSHGPSSLFLYHPALGPLYSLIAQKIIKGRMAIDSELQLEIADLYLEHLDLEGRLLVIAKHILGHNSQGIVRYSHKTGKCLLKKVVVKNRGINRKMTRDYWKNQIKRHQALKIVLQGHSEFYAEGVTFEGGQTFVVPDGQRWIATQNGSGAISFIVEKPGWKWSYKEQNGSLFLEGID